MDENPAFYSSLRERLEEIIEARRQKRIDAAEQLKLLEEVRQKLRAEAEVRYHTHHVEPAQHSALGASSTRPPRARTTTPLWLPAPSHHRLKKS